MKNFRALLFISLLVLVGCATQRPYDGVVRAPKTQIDVFEDGQMPNHPYTVIMEYSEKGDTGKEAQIHSEFIEKAKALGADAIIMKPEEFGGVSATMFSAGFSSLFSAVAIVYQ